jgi:hypothetical protein
MSQTFRDVILMPEMQARAALSGRRLRVRVVAPIGSWLGAGTLRVLRASEREGTIELDCGYESYVRGAASP